MSKDSEPTYASRAVRANALMHVGELRAFLATWRRAVAAELALPETSDPNYASLDALLSHVFKCARGYAVWLCEQAELPSPPLETAPRRDQAAERADAYTDHLIEHWGPSLTGLENRQLRLVRTSTWGVDYNLDGMLEHAVMHPKRHRFQLEELLDGLNG